MAVDNRCSKRERQNEERLTLCAVIQRNFTNTLLSHHAEKTTSNGLQDLVRFNSVAKLGCSNGRWRDDLPLRNDGHKVNGTNRSPMEAADEDPLQWLTSEISVGCNLSTFLVDRCGANPRLANYLYW